MRPTIRQKCVPTQPLIAVWASIGINLILISLKILMTASLFFLYILFRAFKR